ncbi:MAG: hypothetical protein GY699_15275 [Desulfobacteraceae bacterium]|nr:hypothetical protein [Desulfobacteraceae bacterium]
MLFHNITDFHDATIRLTSGCVVALDATGRILEFNSYLKKITQERIDAFAGESWFDIFAPVKLGKHSQTYCKNEILQNHKAGNTHKVLAVYEKNLFIEWNFLTVKDSDTTSAGILGVGIDVTKHIELEQQLQHADRLATVGQLAAGVAHELNGPLNNILGYAQLSSKQQDLPEQVYQDIDHIIRNTLHSREIVKKVMLFSRQVPPGHETINLNKVIQESLYFTEPLCRQNNIEIVCELVKNPPEIIGDFSQLRQVVVNLVVNAAQAISQNGGKITLETSIRSSKCITMVIKDTGTGMSPDTLDHCFMPFFTTKDVDQGTGLGLSVVHGIIQSHNGTITADSEMGKGSRFDIIFPVKPGKGDKNVG